MAKRKTEKKAKKLSNTKQKSGWGKKNQSVPHSFDYDLLVIGSGPGGHVQEVSEHGKSCIKCFKI